MVFVCGVMKNGVLYAIDTKFYSTSTGAEKRCKVLNVGGNHHWIVLYQNQWKVFNNSQ